MAGKVRAVRAVRGRRFSFSVPLPRRDVYLRVTALGVGRSRASTVGPVFGLPRSAAPRSVAGYEDRRLARRVLALARGFEGTSAVYVQDLRTGVGAAWNARARFPAASTVKLAIAVELLRTLAGRPPPGSWLGRLLHDMLVFSDNAAANELLVWLGGSTSGGAARVNATLRALGLTDTHVYGGFAVAGAASGPAREPIPIRVESQPSFVGKYTTAWDLARLIRLVHLAAAGKGRLAQRFRRAFTPSDARHLLFILARVQEPGRLDRYLGPSTAVLHKAGWIRHARHDNGLVYWPGGVFVAAVMTWNGAGVGASADVLAGRVARAALERFRRLPR